MNFYCSTINVLIFGIFGIRSWLHLVLIVEPDILVMAEIINLSVLKQFAFELFLFS